MRHTTPRHGCRPPMPPVEVGLMWTLGGVPVVLHRSTDPGLVRQTVESAIQVARQRDDIAGRQETRLLTGLLEKI